MTKEEFDSRYVDNKKAVLCNTKEKARSFTELAHSFGYRWSNGESYLTDNWQKFKESTCYRIYDGTVCSYSYYFGTRHNVIVYEEDDSIDPLSFFVIIFKKIVHSSNFESDMIEVADIAVRAKDVKNARFIGINYAEISNLSWDKMNVKEYSFVHTDVSVADPCFFKVDVRLREGRKLTFDKRSEFRTFCEENGIYYDFKNGLMLKDNKLFGVFSDIGKTMQNNHLNMLNL